MAMAPAFSTAGIKSLRRNVDLPVQAVRQVGAVVDRVVIHNYLTSAGRPDAKLLPEPQNRVSAEVLCQNVSRPSVA